VTSVFRQWTLDVLDVEQMAVFWSRVLGYRIQAGEDGDAFLLPPDDAGERPRVWLQPTDHVKQAKNRNHPDLVVDDNNVDREVQRLLDLGARHTDVGQTSREGFVVLIDPEGNEFCLLRTPPNQP
jgi:hypothetical protein